MIPIGFDKTVLMRVTAGDEALALEMVELLMNDLPRQREQILAASARGSRHELARLAHSLAGGAAYCGALELKRRCLELENCLLGAHAFEVGRPENEVLDEIERLLSTDPDPQAR